MRKLLTYLSIFFLCCSCLDFEGSNPYEENLYHVAVEVVLPSDISNNSKEGVTIKVTDQANGNSFTAVTDMNGKAEFKVVNGFYMISADGIFMGEIYKASIDGVKVSESSLSVKLNMVRIKTGDIVFKEIYCGGCKKAPKEGEYHMDSYVIVHNNSSSVYYLDGLCFGCVSPYNSNSVNPWISKDPETGVNVLREYVPVVQAVWQIGGDGQSFPLQPGEDAVIAIFGAIDHSAEYPLSVNLNKEDYFVCYNAVAFPNTNYHPTPGDKIQHDHILNMVIKTGKANAYTFSISSPAAILFRTEGVTIQEFVADSENIILTPGTQAEYVVCVPEEWIVDAVEVFNGGSSSNTKRLLSTLDGSYITLSTTYSGASLIRKTNTERSQMEGYEILIDTNDSINDFYESDKQLLHKDNE